MKRCQIQIPKERHIQLWQVLYLSSVSRGIYRMLQGEGLLWWVTGPLLSNGAVLHQFNALLAKCWSSWIGMRITLDSLPAQNSPLLIATDSVVRSFLNQTERRGTTRMPFITTSISLDMAFWNPIVNNTQSPPKSFPCLSLSLRNLSGMSEYIFLILSDIRLKLSLVKIST